MVGFFDSLSDSLENRLGDRPGETGEEMLHRKLPATSYADDLIGNIPQGIMNLGQGTYEAVTHPGQTAESLAGYAMNPRQTASDIYQHYAGRYRNLPTALETLRNDPVGVAGDVLPFTALQGFSRGATSAARRMRPTVSSGEVISPAAAREVGATPRGWDIAGPRESGRTIEGDVAVEPYLIGGEGAPAPRRAVNYTSEVPLPRYTDYGPKISTELNPQIADLLRSIRAEGRAPNRFESNMLSSYFRGQQGSAAAEAMANMPVSVIPRGVQRALNNIRAEGREPTKLELLNMKKHFAGRTGLKSRAALDRVSMGEELAGPYPEFRGAIREEMAAAPEELAASEGTRESLINRALNIASRVGPRVAEGMAIGAPAGMATGLAYNAMMNRGDMPVVPIANREERPVIAPMQLREFPMSTAMGTDFESVPSIASDMPQETALPPRRPMGVSRSGEAPVRRPSAPHHAAPIHRSAPRHVGPSRMVDSGKRYYGDWRDAEPYASDPIGGFIDELTGRTRTARRPGRAAPSSAGLGDLLPFASGGTVRRPFANGGAEDRIPVLSDIGDALGGMMQGGEEPVVASDRGAAPEGRENIFERWSNNPLSQYLFAAGLGMMASPQANPLMAVGEGGLRGLEYMQAVQANADMRRREREAAANRREILERSRNIDKGVFGEADEQTAVPSTSKTAEAEPAQSSSVVSPQEPAKSPVQAAPSSQPVVAADNQVKKINRAIQEYTSLREAASDSMTKSDLAFKIKQLESVRDKIERQREKAVQDSRYQEQLNLQRERLEEQKRQASPEYKRQVQKEEKLGTRLNELETEINEAAGGAKDYIESFDVYKKGIENGNIVTGAYGEDRLNTHKTLQAFAENTGAYSKNWMENAKLRSQLSDDLKSGAIQQVFSQLKGHLGAGISDADRKAIERMGISLDRDARSNLDSIETFQKAQQRNIEAAKFMEDYKQNKSSIPGELDGNFQAAFAKWRNEQPSVLPDRLKAMISKNKESASKEYSGPVITDDKGNKMRLSDDKKSWVEF